MTDLDRIARYLHTRQGWDLARRRLIADRARLPGNLRSRLGPSEGFADLVATATQVPAEAVREESAAAGSEIAARLARLPEDTLRQLWRGWLEEPTLFLHMLIADILRQLPAPSEALALEVLDAGIRYLDPSFNRRLLEAATAVLGLARALEELVARTESEDPDDLEAVARTSYWLGSPEPAQDLSPEERFLDEELRIRLRKVAAYLRPWWMFW